jgi:hypothetical protein
MEPTMGLTFEKVWAMFQEDREQMERSKAEHDRQMKELREQMKETDQRLGALTSKLGKLIENGVYVMAVEVKTDLSTEDVNEHIERMDIVRKYADEHEDKRKYLGAVAGGIVSESARKYARRKGFFVLEQTGDTVKIAETPKEWKPREW